MIGHRVAAGQGWSRMAAAAQLIDGFFQNEDLIRRMGIMTGHAARSSKNIVNKGDFLLTDGSDELRHVAVAGQTNIQGTLGPELMAMIFTVRIMAQSAAAQVDRAMRDRLFEPVFFARMTGQADIPNGRRRHADAPGIDGLLVTTEALAVGGRAVIAAAAFHQARMTGHATVLLGQSDPCHLSRFVEDMTACAAFG